MTECRGRTAPARAGTGTRAMPAKPARPAITRVAVSPEAGNGQFGPPGCSPCGSRAGNGRFASPTGICGCPPTPWGVRHDAGHPQCQSRQQQRPTPHDVTEGTGQCRSLSLCPSGPGRHAWPGNSPAMRI
jgi:hypothetical protein